MNGLNDQCNLHNIFFTGFWLGVINLYGKPNMWPFIVTSGGLLLQKVVAGSFVQKVVIRCFHA
jgi:hypothetical protein